MDLERDAGLTKNDLNNVCAKWIPRVESAIGRQIMIYTSPGFFDSQLPLTNWAWRKPLWVAHWTKADQPRLPKEWSNHNKTWLYWQHSSDKNGLGSQYGVATKNIDLNRFNGSADDFITMYGLSTLPGIQPEDPPETPAGGLLFRVTNPYVHLFDSPTVRSRIAGDLETGEIVEVTDIAGSDEV